MPHTRLGSSGNCQAFRAGKWAGPPEPLGTFKGWPQPLGPCSPSPTPSPCPATLLPEKPADQGFWAPAALP